MKVRIQVLVGTLCSRANVSKLLEGMVGDALEGEGITFLRNVGETVAR
jgi:hypothetical protein